MFIYSLPVLFTKYLSNAHLLCLVLQILCLSRQRRFLYLLKWYSFVYKIPRQHAEFVTSQILSPHMDLRINLSFFHTRFYLIHLHLRTKPKLYLTQDKRWQKRKSDNGPVNETWFEALEELITYLLIVLLALNVPHGSFFKTVHHISWIHFAILWHYLLGFYAYNFVHYLTNIYMFIKECGEVNILTLRIFCCFQLQLLE
jgi:hypothetical protein